MLGPVVLRGLLDAHGGFTVDLRSGAPVSSGLSVCLDPHLSLAVPRSGWRDEVVGQWLSHRADALAGGRRFLGGWLDPATAVVSLDVVRVVPGWLRWPAVVAGRARGQRFAFDLGRRQLVAVRSAS